MKRVLIILLPLIFFSCDSNTGKKPPKWTHSIDKSDIIIQSVGIAESKHESILNVMCELSNIIHSEVEQIIKKEYDSTYVNELDFSNETISSTSEMLFGKVTINALLKDYREEVGIGDQAEISKHTELTEELSFSDGHNQLLYKSFFTEKSSEIDTSFSHYFEMIEKNCTLKDLIDELNSVGCEFDFYSDNENYYTLVRYEKKRLLENINKQHYNPELAKKLFEELEQEIEKAQK